MNTSLAFFAFFLALSNIALAARTIYLTHATTVTFHGQTYTIAAQTTLNYATTTTMTLTNTSQQVLHESTNVVTTWRPISSGQSVLYRGHSSKGIDSMPTVSTPSVFTTSMPLSATSTALSSESSAGPPTPPSSLLQSSILISASYFAQQPSSASNLMSPSASRTTPSASSTKPDSSSTVFTSSSAPETTSSYGSSLVKLSSPAPSMVSSTSAQASSSSQQTRNFPISSTSLLSKSGSSPSVKPSSSIMRAYSVSDLIALSSASTVKSASIRTQRDSISSVTPSSLILTLTTSSASSTPVLSKFSSPFSNSAQVPSVSTISAPPQSSASVAPRSSKSSKSSPNLILSRVVPHGWAESSSSSQSTPFSWSYVQQLNNTSPPPQLTQFNKNVTNSINRYSTTSISSDNIPGTNSSPTSPSRENCWTTVTTQYPTVSTGTTLVRIVHSGTIDVEPTPTIITGIKTLETTVPVPCPAFTKSPDTSESTPSSSITAEQASIPPAIQTVASSSTESNCWTRVTTEVPNVIVSTTFMPTLLSGSTAWEPSPVTSTAVVTFQTTVPLPCPVFSQSFNESNNPPSEASTDLQRSYGTTTTQISTTLLTIPTLLTGTAITESSEPTIPYAPTLSTGIIGNTSSSSPGSPSRSVPLISNTASRISPGAEAALAVVAAIFLLCP